VEVVVMVFGQVRRQSFGNSDHWLEAFSQCAARRLGLRLDGNANTVRQGRLAVKDHDTVFDFTCVSHS
jgi:hypothetical protein